MQMYAVLVLAAVFLATTVKALLARPADTELGLNATSGRAFTTDAIFAVLRKALWLVEG